MSCTPLLCPSVTAKTSVIADEKKRNGKVNMKLDKSSLTPRDIPLNYVYILQSYLVFELFSLFIE